jgi:hypothetical protein
MESQLSQPVETRQDPAAAMPRIQSGWKPTQGKEVIMIRKLKSGSYRLYSRKLDARTGKRRNLGTFATRAQAERHERAVQYFKHH